MTQHWNAIRTAFADRANAALKEASKLHEGPIGSVPRSPQEQAALWSRITKLEDPELNNFMDSMMKVTGHEEGEKRPCQGCAFVLKHASKGA